MTYRCRDDEYPKVVPLGIDGVNEEALPVRVVADGRAGHDLSVNEGHRNLQIMEPIAIAGDLVKKIDIEVNVSGGGVMGQANASRTAVAKAIVGFTGDAELKRKYLAYDRSLLVSDPRRKLPKKPLGRGARVKMQKSYR